MMNKTLLALAMSAALVGCNQPAKETQSPEQPQTQVAETVTPQQQAQQRQQYNRATLPPRNSSSDTIGFIHIGKTGGSTITTMIRNGCNSLSNSHVVNTSSSFSSSSCTRTIKSNNDRKVLDNDADNESQLSKLIEHYYHVPDFWRLPTSNHETFLISMRDVFDRSISSLLYQHPLNAQAYNLTLSNNQKTNGPMAYRCFPTLEAFAMLLPKYESIPNCNYPYKFNQIVATDCNALACAVIHGKVRFFSHLYFNYQNIIQTKINSFINFDATIGDSDTINRDKDHPSVNGPRRNERQIYVIRQERFWHDWINVNRLLGQTTPIIVPPNSGSAVVATTNSSSTSSSSLVLASKSSILIQRNISGFDVPVKRNISKEGRYYLCQALELEYVAYFKILRKALNIRNTSRSNTQYDNNQHIVSEDYDELQSCVDIAKRNCPNLNIHEMAYN